MNPSSEAPEAVQKAYGSRSSVVVERCQISGSTDLRSVLFLGFIPPVNQMLKVGTRAVELPAYPAEMLYCPESYLAQLGLIVDPQILFAPDYPYTSGTTRILRENFAELYQESQTFLPLGPDDLTIDIGSNDGTLLSNFHQAGHRVLGIEPTQAGKLARDKGIETLTAFFNAETAAQVRQSHGQARIITAANVFAHMEDIHGVMHGILDLLADDGLFISESHYLMALLRTVQYDTIYHEHMRYYSLHSLRYLFDKHGLEIVHARPIPTHGGSIRVYAARPGRFPGQPSVAQMLEDEDIPNIESQFETFRKRVVSSKLELYRLLADIKARGERVYGIGAPSRASTLICYTGLDDNIIDCVLEVSNSHKLDKYMPGTRIPVRDEAMLFQEQPEYVLLLSWHIADELIPKLAAKGYKGKYIVPLPEPHIRTA